MEAATAARRDQLVTVTLTLTDETGDTTQSETIDSGPTEVEQLKSELGVAPEAALWVIGKNDKKRQLADHQTYNVKDGDHFEAIRRGGVS